MAIKVVEIGTCNAIVSAISTMKDGGYKLTLELNPDDKKVINKLMDRYGDNKKVLQLGVLGVEE
jgi:hypothetical protein